VQVRGPMAAGRSKEVTAALDEIERLLRLSAPYGEASELAQLNAKAGTGRVKVSRDLYDMLSLAADFARRSDGAYDPTLAGRGRVQLELHPPERAIRLIEKKVGVDLGAVAHGFAAQAAWAVLGSAGVKRFLVRVGAVYVAADAPSADSAGWVVEVEKGLSVQLTGRAFASHAGEHSAAVIATDGPTAAALAQSLTGMPWKNAVALATSANGAEARIVSAEGPAETLGFQAFVAKP
jgi:thiamine biosynthesis lipoprotein ApbE